MDDMFDYGLPKLISATHLLFTRAEEEVGSAGGFQFQSDAPTSIENAVQFASAKSVRASIVTLASFNALAGLITAAGIYWDCYRRLRRQDSYSSFRSCFLRVISPVEVLPFAMSIGTVVQSTIFAIVQSRGLASLLTLGCSPLSQLMLPTVFITPFIELAFGIETAIRALRRQCLPAKSRIALPLCVGSLILALLAAFVVAHAIPPPDLCFASLFFFVQYWSTGCLGVFVGTVFLLLLASMIIFFQLKRQASMDRVERMAASRLVFYLVIGAVSNAMVIPFFFGRSFDNAEKSSQPPVVLAMLACIVTNLSGFTTGGMYLALRLRGRSLMKMDGKGLRNIGPERNSSPFSWVTGRHAYATQMMQPISPIQGNGTKSWGHSWKGMGMRIGSETRSLGTPVEDQQTLWIPNTLHVVNASPCFSEKTSLSPRPERGSVDQETLGDEKGWIESWMKSGSCSPSFRDQTALESPVMPPALQDVDQMDFLVPPPPLLALGVGHRRDSSMISSATVQIGLRLSNVNYLAQTSGSMNFGDLPNPKDRGFGRSLTSSGLWPARAPNFGIKNFLTGGTSRRGSSDKNNSTDGSEKRDESEDDGYKLSPSVYSPPPTSKPAAKIRITSPKGVGFKIPLNKPHSEDIAGRASVAQGQKDHEWI